MKRPWMPACSAFRIGWIGEWRNFGTKGEIQAERDERATSNLSFSMRVVHFVLYNWHCPLRAGAWGSRGISDGSCSRAAKREPSFKTSSPYTSAERRVGQE